MNLKIIRWALGICAACLFIFLLIGIGSVLESHTFRASVSGSVTDVEGNPIAGARVEYCLPNAPGDTTEYDMSSQTDSEGRYSMSLPVFTVALDTSPDYRRHVRISADGYAPLGTHAILKKGQNADCNFVLVADAEERPKDRR